MNWYSPEDKLSSVNRIVGGATGSYFGGLGLELLEEDWELLLEDWGAGFPSFGIEEGRSGMVQFLHWFLDDF